MDRIVEVAGKLRADVAEIRQREPWRKTDWDLGKAEGIDLALSYIAELTKVENND